MRSGLGLVLSCLKERREESVHTHFDVIRFFTSLRSVQNDKGESSDDTKGRRQNEIKHRKIQSINRRFPIKKPSFYREENGGL